MSRATLQECCWRISGCTRAALPRSQAMGLLESTLINCSSWFLWWVSNGGVSKREMSLGSTQQPEPIVLPVRGCWGRTWLCCRSELGVISCYLCLLPPGMFSGFPPSLQFVSLQGVSGCFQSSLAMSKEGILDPFKTHQGGLCSQPPLCQVLLGCGVKPPQSCAQGSFGLLQNPPKAGCCWCSAWTTPAPAPPSTWTFVPRSCSPSVSR